MKRLHGFEKCNRKTCACYRDGWLEGLHGARKSLLAELEERCRLDKVDPHNATCRCDACGVMRAVQKVLDHGLLWTVAASGAGNVANRYKGERSFPAKCYGPDCGKEFYTYRRGVGKWCSARCRMRAYRARKSSP